MGGGAYGCFSNSRKILTEIMFVLSLKRTSEEMGLQRCLPVNKRLNKKLHAMTLTFGAKVMAK